MSSGITLEVQCYACNKWRMLLPDSVTDEEDIAETWYCGMNVQDPINNSCEASEKDYLWYEDHLDLLVPSEKGNEEGKRSESPPRKKACIRNSLEPDVTIIVGGKEFQDCSQSLCRWSDYFDKALKSGMKESKTMKFEFPDRDPEEWKWIAGLAAPFSQEKIKKNNVWKAASWFDELLSESGSALCDKVVRLEILSGISRKLAPALADPDTGKTISPEVKRGLGLLLETTSNCVKFNIKSSKKLLCIYFLQEVLRVRVLLTKANLGCITALMKDDEDVRVELLKKLRRYLPSAFSEQQIQLLLDNDMLHEIVYLEWSRKKLKRRIVHLANSGRSPSSSLNRIAVPGENRMDHI